MENFTKIPALDYKQIEQLRELDDDSETLFGELLNIWEKTVAEVFKELEEAILTEEIKSVEHLCHKMKGSCANIGAMRLSSMCEKIEVVASKGTLNGIAELFTLIQKEYPESKSALCKEFGLH